ncbi:MULTISPECIES: LysR substrate-binding domain-containing protein [unclassified Moraxella]|uniref:LysR substrate-binding domain-containing protein n=1 Tax=unclassified Moraxella TaxID=2685852 RepID=UPI00359DD550
MDIRHLKYFVAVVEEQSFTKASERLFIAQPPLSRQIQNLEDELGLPLLERGSRPIKTTEAGQFFYQYAKRILGNMEQMVSMTRRVGQADKTLKVGFVGSLLLGLLPQVIFEFRKLLPNINIELVEMGTLEQIEALKSGKIDVGFGRLKFSDPSIARILLRDESLVLAVNEREPRFIGFDGVYLSDVTDEVLWCYPNVGDHTFANYIKNVFAEHGLSPKGIRYISNIQLALGMVASGEGISIVPQNSKAISMANLKYLPILDAGAVSPIFLSFRNGDDGEFIQLLLKTIEIIYQQIGINKQITLNCPPNP